MPPGVFNPELHLALTTTYGMALLEGKVAPALRGIPKFRQAFLGSINAGGRVHEIGILRKCMLKTPKSGLRAKIWSRGLLEQAELG